MNVVLRGHRGALRGVHGGSAGGCTAGIWGRGVHCGVGGWALVPLRVHCGVHCGVGPRAPQGASGAEHLGEGLGAEQGSSAG